MRRAILLNGIIDNDDFEKLMSTVREIEQKNPHEDFMVTFHELDETGMSIQEASEFLKKTFPSEEKDVFHCTAHNAVNIPAGDMAMLLYVLDEVGTAMGMLQTRLADESDERLDSAVELSIKLRDIKHRLKELVKV